MGKGGGEMEALIRDIRYAIRSLMKNTTFAVVAIVTIALGIGANTAIFSVVQAVLLKPLPYDQPEELVMVWGRLTARNVENFATSPPVLRDMRESSRLFESFAGVNSFPAALSGEGDPLQIQVGSVTPNFFELLGTELLMGRDFLPEDATPLDSAAATPFGPGANAPTVTILSHSLWQQSFGGDAAVLGRTIDFGGNLVEVIGVLRPDFELLMPTATNVAPDVAAWTTPRLNFDLWNPANVVWSIIGRLNEGVTVAQAQSEMDVLAAREREKIQVFNTAGFEMEVISLHEDITEQVRPTVLALLGAVLFVLLIACANVSNLLLVRSSVREREFAVRAALGGSRARLIRQLLAESGVLAVLGAALGLLLAQGGIELLLAFQPADLPRVADATIDGTVLGVTVVATLVSAVLFGVIPAIQGTKLELSQSLKDRGRASSVASNRILRNAVVVGEVALSVVLLVGTGLMVRSFTELQRIDPGFEAESVLTFNAAMPGGRYPTALERHQLQSQFQERLMALPGVEAVGAALPIPLRGPVFNGRYGTEEARADESFFKQAAYKMVIPGYFAALRTELVSGRVFTAADNSDSLAVVVVDQKLARLTWPGESAVGKVLLIRLFTPDPIEVEVIGVVEHQRHAGLAEESRETIFSPNRFAGSFGNPTWLVRGTNPMGLVDAIRAELRTLDPRIPLAEVREFQGYVDDAMAPTRFALILIGAFGVTAVLLAGVGLYGVLSSVVRQRTAEIGVRMAFGAQKEGILRLVVGQGLVLAGAGLIGGLVMALGVTRLMESLLVGVTPTDPVTFAGISAVFAVVAIIACYLPARRATMVDPTVALREE